MIPSKTMEEFIHMGIKVPTSNYMLLRQDVYGVYASLTTTSVHETNLVYTYDAVGNDHTLSTHDQFNVWVGTLKKGTHPFWITIKYGVYDTRVIVMINTYERMVVPFVPTDDIVMTKVINMAVDAIVTTMKYKNTLTYVNEIYTLLDRKVNMSIIWSLYITYKLCVRNIPYGTILTYLLTTDVSTIKSELYGFLSMCDQKTGLKECTSHMDTVGIHSTTYNGDSDDPVVSLDDVVDDTQPNNVGTLLKSIRGMFTGIDQMIDAIITGDQKKYQTAFSSSSNHHVNIYSAVYTRIGNTSISKITKFLPQLKEMSKCSRYGQIGKYNEILDSIKDDVKIHLGISTDMELSFIYDYFIRFLTNGIDTYTGDDSIININTYRTKYYSSLLSKSVSTVSVWYRSLLSILLFPPVVHMNYSKFIPKCDGKGTSLANIIIECDYVGNSTNSARTRIQTYVDKIAMGVSGYQK